MQYPAATLELKFPIVLGKTGERIDRLEFRRVKMKDTKDLPSDPIVSSVLLVSRLTALPPSTIEELDAIDFQEASRIIEGFLPKSQKAGEQSSDGLPIE